MSREIHVFVGTPTGVGTAEEARGRHASTRGPAIRAAGKKGETWETLEILQARKLPKAPKLTAKE